VLPDNGSSTTIASTVVTTRASATIMANASVFFRSPPNAYVRCFLALDGASMQGRPIAATAPNGEYFSIPVSDALAGVVPGAHTVALICQGQGAPSVIGNANLIAWAVSP
jgi:hypothetical protein